jgi:hypothetical protein
LLMKRARKAIASSSEDRREAVRQELEAVAASQLTDVVTWEADEDGHITDLQITPSSKLSQRAKRGIKKIKITPTKYGREIEIEMHDKLSALRILARAEGLLEAGDDADRRPTISGITLRGPAVEPVKADDGAISEAAAAPQGEKAGDG